MLIKTLTSIKLHIDSKVDIKIHPEPFMKIPVYEALRDAT